MMTHARTAVVATDRGVDRGADHAPMEDRGVGLGAGALVILTGGDWERSARRTGQTGTWNETSLTTRTILDSQMTRMGMTEVS